MTTGSCAVPKAVSEPQNGILLPQTDSDSGHGRTSSSSSLVSSPDGDQAFVDASDEPNKGEEEDEEGGGLDKEVPLEAPIDGSGQKIRAQEQVELRLRLEETGRILRMALNNEFASALEICSRRAHEELYASLATATLSFLRAALTLERGDLHAALSAINKSFEVSAIRRRKTSTASMMMRLIYRPNYNDPAGYTDDQIHAELVHAESLLLLALISFLADQSIICLVRGAIRIRTCYQRYKECLYIMEQRTCWSSEEARKHFESGVRMGLGIFNLLMSYLPSRVLRFLEYVGFSGNRSIGVEELERSIKLNDGLRSVFSSLVILTYHSYIENLFGLGAYDAEKVEELSNSLLGDYPNSAFFLLFRGRFHQMQGNLDKAIESFEQCILAQDDWKQFHSICHWEIMWCFAVQMDWKKAAHYSDLLRKHSKWSQASYTYQYATFLYAQLVEDQRANLISQSEYELKIEEIKKIMQRVPELRVRFAGKTIPAEKFAITRTAKFCRQQNRLTLPALEFLYIWNIFATLRSNPQRVEKLLERINSEIEHLEQEEAKQAISSCQSDEEEEVEDEGERSSSDSSSASVSDDLSLVLLLKGMCLKHLNRVDEAEQVFLQIVDNEPNICEDTFLVPHTAMELAVLKLSQRQYDEAKRWIKMARHNYTGYLLETIVHFRLHAASRQIRIEQQEHLLACSLDSSEPIDNNNSNRSKLSLKSQAAS